MANAATLAENKRTVDRFVEVVVNEGDLDRLDEFVAEDVIDHTPLGETRGSDGIRETIESVRTAFPDFTVIPEVVVAEGDTVAVRMIQRGTHEGEFMGNEPTGESFEIAAMGFIRCLDGEIAERWVLADVLALLRQLGVEAPDVD